MGLIRKLFLDGDWKIGIRKHQNKGLFDYSSDFVSVKDNKKFWFADPLVFNYKGTSFLFCEAFDKKEYKGVIGYFVIDENAKVGEFRECIREGYHLSYPCIFEKDDKVYMVPESGENNSLALYEAKNFPNDWVKVKSLNTDFFADPTIYTLNGEIYLFVYNEKKPYQAKLYKFDKNLDLVLINTINYEKNVGRPAGYFFNYDKNLYRPAQNSSEMYGKSIRFYQINNMESSYKEEAVLDVNNNEIIVDRKKGVDRIHTYSTDGVFECIDYNNLHFHLFKRFNIIKRSKAVKRRKQERGHQL